jgi:hypothetical protein
MQALPVSREQRQAANGCRRGGTLYMGFGEHFDEIAMKALQAGSICTEPRKQPHFVWAKDGDVVIQVVGGNGPSGVTRIEPK